MLGVGLFAALWVVLGLGVFYVAVRGGLGRAREPFQTQTPGGRNVITGLFIAAYIGFGAIIPALILVGNHSNANAQVGGIKLTRADKDGRELFGQHCGLCHTLAAANAVGKIGPNLDVLQPAASLVLHTILNGCVQTPSSTSSPQTCLGQGTMPANVVQGREAQDVANFVAKVAGKE